MASGDLITRIYSGFRGADFRGEEINLVRSPDCLNVWKDYKHTDSIRTRPAMELFKDFPETVYGIYFYKIGSTEMCLVHSGKSLYKIANGEKTYIGDLNAAPSTAFVYNNTFYILDGINYKQYDGSTLKDVVGYVPTTSIGRKASGGGKVHEDVNLLSDWRINTFMGDGESTIFYLDTYLVEQSGGYVPTQNMLKERVHVTVNGESWDDRIMNISAYDGVVTLSDVPPAPLTDGQDNVSIEFRKDTYGQREKITRCTLSQVFDNRVFFSGNKDYPNTIWHCSLNDPSYFSDLDYYNEGLDSAVVNGLVAGNNALWVFKEPSISNTSVFYHTPTIDSEYGKVYPNTHSTISMGCVGKAINFNDDIVFFSERGMEGISGDVTTEQFVAHRSSLVDRKLIAEKNYKNMILTEWEGYLLVIIDDKIYLADSRATFTNENHIEYEWFYFSLDKVITCASVYNGILYLGTSDGVYTLTDTKKAVKSYWVTPKDKINNPHRQKTTNKKGCVVEATGDVSVYAKTEKTDFELISKFKDVTDLNALKDTKGLYIMVLDEYQQVYIGTAAFGTNIKKRIMNHWSTKKHFGRLLNGRVENSILSIDSFGALDTTRIFYKKLQSNEEIYLLEEKYIKDFKPEYRLNRVAGGINSEEHSAMRNLKLISTMQTRNLK